MDKVSKWDEARIQQLIDDKIEESLTLEYKAAAALEKTDKKKVEVTKDVSAMANSAGGIIIYGVKEYKDAQRKHLPESIDPIGRVEISREWLEQVINNIQPRITDLTIHPVPVFNSDTKVVYVVEIPQSMTPHQAQDKLYYRRYNFLSESMRDYEINDIRNRRFIAATLVSFDVELRHGNAIFFTLENPGNVPAQDVTFAFSKEPTWPDNYRPPIFYRGISFLPPRRRHSYYYGQYVELVNSNNDTTSQFVLVISYYHPQLGRKLEESFYIDLADFMGSAQLNSAIEEQTERTVKALRDLTGHLKGIRENLSKLLKIAGPSGLQLSDKTLRNLGHIARNDQQLEKIDPYLFPLNTSIYREVLGIEQQLASKIAWHFFQPVTGESLRDIEGMTDELYARVQSLFRIDEEE